MHISHRVLFYLIVFLALVLRLHQFFVTDNFYWHGDGFSRLQYAYEMLRQFEWFPHVDWLPFHFYFLYVQFLLFENTVDVPRLASILVSILAIYPLFKISEFWSRSKNVATITIFLYAISYPYILYSTLTLSEPLNATLCLFGIFFFMSYLSQNKENIRPLVFCGMFFILAILTRYDSWLIAFYCGVYLVLEKPKSRDVVLYGVMTCIPILIVFIVLHNKTGDFFRGVNFSDYEVRSFYKLQPTSLYVKLSSVYYAFPFFSLIFALPFSFLSMFRKNNFLPTILCSTLTFIFYKLLIDQTIFHAARYFLIQSILLLVFLAELLNRLIQSKKIHLYSKMAILLFGFSLSSWITYSWMNHKIGGRAFKYSHGYLESARWFKQADLPDKGKIFLDKDKYYSMTAWPVYAGIKDHSINGCYFHDRPWDNDRSTLQEIFDCIRERDIQYLVEVQGSYLLKEFAKPEDLHKALELSPLYQSSYYKIYKIIKVNGL